MIHSVQVARDALPPFQCLSLPPLDDPSAQDVCLSLKPIISAIFMHLFLSMTTAQSRG